ncbi:MAG: hypothetical protein AVDCRST_MAG55-2818 [uncultured Rubrobacteraceae bacterium]|jgi:hypothetical protein|uniref:Uncharacterized protein n=1 Tax=uncultured Rubrobacteraceae bacterium TaxID=349277 RepID=A0A6J4QBR7_9ACTN|nr:MAG: hypothetical protein AVDCRST_MAG55-2818 [uncultured Rubrobacteraceae bacterium]
MPLLGRAWEEAAGSVVATVFVSARSDYDNGAA